MLTEFGTILIFLILVGLAAAGVLTLRRALRPSGSTHGGSAVSEHVTELKGPSHPGFSLRCYVVPLALLLLELTLVLLFPMVIASQQSGAVGLLLGAVVVFIPVVGGFYLWGKRDLDSALLRAAPGMLAALLTRENLRSPRSPSQPDAKESRG